MPKFTDLIAEVNEAIRVHHASGFFSRAEATARLMANGLNIEQAADLLDQPVDVALFDEWKTYPPELRVARDGTQ